MLAVFRMLFHGNASPGESTTGCRTSGMLGQNVRQRLGEFAIKRRNVCGATHDLRKGRDPPALTVIFLSALRASALFGSVSASTPFLNDALGHPKGALE